MYILYFCKRLFLCPKLVTLRSREDSSTVALRLINKKILNFLLILLFSTGGITAGISLQTDREVLLHLQTILKSNNKVNEGRYVEWRASEPSPCEWSGITCSNSSKRVTGIDLSDSSISGEIFANFSALTQLAELDLSNNSFGGEIPYSDLNRCKNLRYLNLSHNLLQGQLNLTGLNSLEILDVSYNRFGRIPSDLFPENCEMISVNLSSNNFSGVIADAFNGCRNLQFLDISSNRFTGPVWAGFTTLREFLASENNITEKLTFEENCRLEVLGVSKNHFHGEVPKNISNCKRLVSLGLSGNEFSGRIPLEIGELVQLEALDLGGNNFSRDIPESLLNCSKLALLDLSGSKFGGDVQKIFGRFVHLKYLALNTNFYTGGINSSGILRLPNISTLDLSFNNFSGSIPMEISEMKNLKFLILAHNSFSGGIPIGVGRLSGLQALDLSYNKLNGMIPGTIGNMTSLLWLTLANNNLNGEIPAEIRNCLSLLWLNLANNHLSGQIPPEISRIGHNPRPTFDVNRMNKVLWTGSVACLVIQRLVPTSIPPFSFLSNALTRKTCRSFLDQMFRGQGLLPKSCYSSSRRALHISGYLQLSGNRFSGHIPTEVCDMQGFSQLHLALNELSGPLPPEISRMRLLWLNLSSNKLSGEIPTELGNIKCLQNLDLSYNNFSGEFPAASLNRLTELSKFNVSYNPLISVEMPITGQITTFGEDSFLGVSLVSSCQKTNRTEESPPQDEESGNASRKPAKLPPALLGFSIFFPLSFFFFFTCSIAAIQRKMAAIQHHHSPFQSFIRKRKERAGEDMHLREPPP